MSRKFPDGYHPGAGYVYVICDVCGRKVRRKDTQKVNDRWNLQNGLVVCKWDIDKVNEQNKPIKVKEKLITNPKDLRSEPTDRFESPDVDDRAPSAPQKLEAKASILGDDVELFWRGPEDVGTSRITGYQIDRSAPQFGTYETLTSNTGTNSTYYLDTSADPSQTYTYIVYAINGAGTSLASNEAPYPTQIVSSATNYLEISQTPSVLETSQGDAIIL